LSRRSIGLGVAAGSLAFAFALARSSEAFVVPGHDAVEAVTYKRIIAAPKVDDGRGGTVSGREAIRVLDPPRLPRATALLRGEVAEGGRRLPRRGEGRDRSSPGRSSTRRAPTS